MTHSFAKASAIAGDDPQSMYMSGLEPSTTAAAELAQPLESAAAVRCHMACKVSTPQPVSPPPTPSSPEARSHQAKTRRPQRGFYKQMSVLLHPQMVTGQPQVGHRSATSQPQASHRSATSQPQVGQTAKFCDSYTFSRAMPPTLEPRCAPAMPPTHTSRTSTSTRI